MTEQLHDRQLEADRRAELTVLWSRSQHLVEAFIRASVFNAHDRDDVLQETAKQAALNFDRYDPERPFANWAVGIARHKVQELRRKTNRDAIMLGGEALDQIAEGMARVKDESADRIAAMEACLEDLQPRHRKLLDLRYTDGLAVQDIAREIGNKPNTVSVALYKVRAALADCVRHRLRREEGGSRGR
ncbi:MAG: sigma-70 family RNA polymerase sigma factor [Phycisphaerales bacterium JB063]